MHRSLRSLAVAAGLLAGCSSLKVVTQFDPAAPFPTYKTYAWLATTPGAEQAATIRDPAVRVLVIDAVDREMGKKGLVRTDPDKNPDFYVSVIGWGHERVEVTNYGYAYAPTYVYGGYGADGSYCVFTLRLEQPARSPAARARERSERIVSANSECGPLNEWI